MQQLVGPTLCPQEGHSLERYTEKEKQIQLMLVNVTIEVDPGP